MLMVSLSFQLLTKGLGGFVNRALYSVYSQKGIDQKRWVVIIVDDNEDHEEIGRIYEEVASLRFRLGMKSEIWPTLLLRNFRTMGRSGTGAWNSGMLLAREIYPNADVCFLDDDDAYAPMHLRNCFNASYKRGIVAVFEQCLWYSSTGHKWIPQRLRVENLTQYDFLIGNPGVQGSNMFFKLKSILDIGGFDENFHSTTDRELMVRFLDMYDYRQIQVLEEAGVFHYCHNSFRVSTSISYKHAGLDSFYRKYHSMFCEYSYIKSIQRARNLFGYKFYI